MPIGSGFGKFWSSDPMQDTNPAYRKTVYPIKSYPLRVKFSSQLGAEKSQLIYSSINWSHCDITKSLLCEDTEDLKTAITTISRHPDFTSTSHDVTLAIPK